MKRVLKVIGNILGAHQVRADVVCSVATTLGKEGLINRDEFSVLNEAFNYASPMPKDTEKELSPWEKRVLGWVPTKHSFCKSKQDYIVWCELWNVIDRQFGLTEYDVLHQSQKQQTAEYLFRVRNEKFREINFESWRKKRGYEMNELEMEFSKALNEFRKTKEYKDISPYKNFWHACIDGPFKNFTRDGMNYWDEAWFDLDKWQPCFWPQVMLLDKLTKNHPARVDGRVSFFVFW